MFLLQLRMRRLEILMSLNRCQVTCLQRGYLPLYKGYLTPKFVLWSIACINHPVEIVKVFRNTFHNHWRMQPNYLITLSLFTLS